MTDIRNIIGVGCFLLALLFATRGFGALVSRQIVAASRLTRPARSVLVQGTRAQALGVLIFIAALVIALSGYLLLTDQSPVLALILCSASLFFSTLFESAVVADK